MSATSVSPRTDVAPGVELVPFPSWRRARDQVCAFLLAGEKLVLVTGSSGTGKTLLLEDVARILRSAGWRVSFHGRGSQLEDELADEGDHSALLVDDADQLSEPELLAACLSEHRPVLLAGSDLLERRCPGSSSVALHSLGMDEAMAFIRLWQSQAGVDEPLDEASVARLLGLSAGIPRLLAILLNAGIWHREKPEEAPRVAVRIQESLRRETSPRPPGPVAEPPRAGLRQSEAEAAQAVSVNAAPSKPARSRGRRVVVGGGLLILLLSAGSALAPERYWPASILPLRSQVRNEARQLATDASVKLAPLYEAMLRRLGQSKSRSAETNASVAGIASHDPHQGPSSLAASTPPRPKLTETPVAFQPARDAAPPAKPPATAPPAPKAAAAPKPTSPITPTPAAETAIMTPTPAKPPAPPVVAATAPPPPPIAAQSQLAPELVKLLLRRGNEMMSLNDYSAARLLFERAVSAGSAEAMVSLGRTYDRATVIGDGGQAGADPAKAAYWYRRAVAAGVPGAAGLVSNVKQQASK